MIVSIINTIISFFISLLNSVLSILPDSPFSKLENFAVNSDFLAAANYFLPIQEVVATCELWLVSITIYYCFMVIGRWAKIFD